jgi:transcription elongation GreA/GreB family factor
MSVPTMTRGERLLAAALAGNAPQIEELFLEMLEQQELTDPNLPAAVDALIDAGRAPQASELASMALEPLETRGPADAAFALLRRLARLTPAEPTLRDRLLAAAPGAFAAHPFGAAVVQTLRLEGGRTAGELAEQLVAATTFAPDDVVRHDGGWGLGRVQEFDPLQLALRVRFVDGTARPFPLLTATRFLVRLAPGSFDHRMVADPESLRTLAKTDPAELIRVLLAARHRRLSLREAKAALTGCGAVAPSTWTKFWQAARTALQADPYVEVGTGVNGILVLRERPKARDTELLDALRLATALPARLDAVRRALAEPAGAMAAEGMVAELLADVRVLAPDDAGPRAAIALVLERLAAVGARIPAWPIDLATLATRPAEAARALATLHTAADRAAVLARLQAQAPDGWPALVAGVLRQPVASDEAYDDAAAACRTGPARDAFRAAAAAAVAAVRDRPIPALWVCGAVLRGTLDPGPPLPDPADCLLRALTELTRASADAEMAKDPEARTVLRRTRAFVPAETILGFLAERSAAALPRLARAVLGCRGIAPKARADIERWFAEHHPDLFSHESEAPRDDRVWVSPGGLARRQAEFDHLMNVEFPRNARDLGEAIAKGDLSENAEYEAARQRQQWLVARAGEMREQLEHAAVIELATVPRDAVAPGSEVTLARDGGPDETWRILGPWDVDLERGIISYLSPLGRALLGKRAGERAVAELPEGSAHVEVRAVAPLPAFPEPRPFVAPATA